MKRLHLIALMFTLFSIMVYIPGCARLQYETKDGTKVTYTRLLTTSDSIKGNVGEARIAVARQEIDTSALQALITLLGGVK